MDTLDVTFQNSANNVKDLVFEPVHPDTICVKSLKP